MLTYRFAKLEAIHALGVSFSERVQIMRRVSLLLSVLLLSPVLANAQSSASVGTVWCSGSQSSSLVEAASFLCSGDYSVADGSITSDSRVVVRADGSLTLANLSIVAPAIELTAMNGPISFGGGVSFNTGSLSFNSFLIGSGGNTSPIPGGSPGATLTLDPGSSWGTLTISSGLAGGTLTLNAAPQGVAPVGPLSVGSLSPGGTLSVMDGVITPLAGGSGGSITLVSSIPEPSTYLSMLAGILALVGFRAGRKGRHA